MKKLLILLLSLLIFSFSFSITVIESPSVYKNDKVIGESYIAKFDNEQEKRQKILREKEYMMSKDEFKFFLDKDGVAYMASYSTPIEYTISFKAFCGDKYISVYGNYRYFDDLLKYFLEKTKSYGYNF